MTVWEGILVAIFCISMVFFVLIGLSLLIKGFSFILGIFSSQMKQDTTPVPAQSETVLENELSLGILKLKDVDEPTAAMIMAIVSDESGIPLSELCFKSIKLLRQD
ncbi:MAG: OadG family protein [Clostridiales bacterium]|nr:OadG family protein [Clostridiales bacterium]